MDMPTAARTAARIHRRIRRHADRLLPGILLPKLLAAALLGLPAMCASAAAISGEVIPPERRIEWSPGLGRPIARYDAAINVKEAPYLAKGNGRADDTAALQKAIDDCPAGKAVFLPRGMYRTSAELVIKGKGIVLRGAGPKQTRLECVSTGGSILGIRGSGTGAWAPVRQGYQKDSTRLTLSDAAEFRVGDYVQILQDNDPAVCEGLHDYMVRAVGQTLQVVAKQGNTLTVNRPLYFSYNPKTRGWVDKWEMFHLTNDVLGLVADLARNGYLDQRGFIQDRFAALPGPADMVLADAYAARKQQTYDYLRANMSSIKLYRRTPTVGAGIEDLSLERMVNGGYDNITLSGAARSWICNVESRKTRKWHVRLLECYACEVRDSYFHDAWDAGGDAAYGVGCFQRATDNLIENNVFVRCRHSMILEHGGCGNVYGYNYSRDPVNEKGAGTDFMMSDLALHGGHPYMNLFEGNVAAHIGCDNVLGSSRHNTFFRNRIERRSLPTVKWGGWAVDVQMNNLYENIVGNVFAPLPAYMSPCDPWRIGYNQLTAQLDPRVAATLLRHGNHDMASGKTQWDEKISARVLPASLYLKSRPAFFGNHPWPAIGPDVEPHAGFLPAKDRYERELIRLPADHPQ
jgi:hypothetical protein